MRPLTRAELRGQGLGLELFEAGLVRGDATTLSLDGVLEQERNDARDGFVAPLFCDDRAAAERLLAALLAHVDDGPVYLDVPVVNAEGVAMARGLRLEPVFETARMYRGPPELRLDRVFGITSFELG
jgi:hypothetical protein